MTGLLKHPLFFDILILALFACAALRAAIDMNPGKAVYWTGACILNVAVVFMLGAK